MSLSVSLTWLTVQRAKKAVSDRPGLVYFSVLNLPNGNGEGFSGYSNYRRTVTNPAHQNFFQAS